MYDKLKESLRLCVKYGKAQDALENAEQAADAIEELQQQVEHYRGGMNEWRDAYIAEHDARIAEVKRLYDAFYEANKKAIELTPLKIVLPQPPKEE